uniref:Uncharacterized protein n=1 Tax=Romanomermis culicivorax TaxID=13658 RepID=A0A915L4K0_ROMCU
MPAASLLNKFINIVKTRKVVWQENNVKEYDKFSKPERNRETTRPASDPIHRATSILNKYLSNLLGHLALFVALLIDSSRFGTLALIDRLGAEVKIAEPEGGASYKSSVYMTPLIKFSHVLPLCLGGKEISLILLGKGLADDLSAANDHFCVSSSQTASLLI